MPARRVDLCSSSSPPQLPRRRRLGRGASRRGGPPGPSPDKSRDSRGPGLRACSDTLAVCVMRLPYSPAATPWPPPGSGPARGRLGIDGAGVSPRGAPRRTMRRYGHDLSVSFQGPACLRGGRRGRGAPARGAQPPPPEAQPPGPSAALLAPGPSSRPRSMLARGVQTSPKQTPIRQPHASDGGASAVPKTMRL